MPGAYELPKGDGIVNIFTDRYGVFKVNMQVSGNAKSYVHDLSHYYNA